MRRRDRDSGPLASRLLLAPDALAGTELPPLFKASTPEEVELHARSYHLVALALRAYITTWYSRFSPRDGTLLPAINEDVIVPLVGPLLAALTTDEGVEAATDLLLLHVPVIATTHVKTYWEARAAVAAGTTDNSLEEAYHARLPSLATTLTAQGGTYALSPEYLAGIVDAVLALRMPNCESVAENLVIREVVARAVLGSIGRRLAAPWFWAQIGLKLCGEPGTPWGKHKALPTPDNTPRRFFDTALRTYRALVVGITLMWSGGAWLIASLSAAPPPSAQYAHVADPWLDLGRSVLGINSHSGLASPSLPVKWAWGTLEVFVLLLSPILDRLLPHLVRTRVLNASVGLRIASLLERLLFPNDGYPGPSPIDPTPEEAADLDVRWRERIAERLPSVVAAGVTPVPVADTSKTPAVARSTRAAAADALLDPLSSGGSNAHLVGMLYSAVVAALLPELVAVEGPPPMTPEVKLAAELAQALKEDGDE